MAVMDTIRAVKHVVPDLLRRGTPVVVPMGMIVLLKDAVGMACIIRPHKDVAMVPPLIPWQQKAVVAMACIPKRHKVVVMEQRPIQMALKCVVMDRLRPEMRAVAVTVIIHPVRCVAPERL